METMATQAASSAASGAASGMSASIAAGAAAGAAASSAMAAAAGATAATTQLATAAAVVGTTVAVASGVAASGVFTEAPVPFSIISTCGIGNPVFHSATIGLFFEGFDREFNVREQELAEALVVESYNLITRGTNQESVGCVDEYLREMQNSTLMDQVFTAGNESFPSTLDLTFDSWVICSGCPDDLPVFGAFTNGGNPQISRRLQSNQDVKVEVDLDLLDQLLKEVVRKIVGLTDSGEFEGTFVPSKIGMKGPSLAANGGSFANDTSVVLLNIPIGYEDDASTNSAREVIFPAPSVCGSSDPDFYPGLWRMSLQGVARAILPGEVGIIENMMLETYNNVSVGSETNADCSDRYQREMSRARLMNQRFIEAQEPDTASKLDITFKTWLICNGCSNVIPLFGTVDEAGGASDFLYDYGMMESSLREIIYCKNDWIDQSRCTSIQSDPNQGVHSSCGTNRRINWGGWRRCCYRASAQCSNQYQY